LNKRISLSEQKSIFGYVSLFQPIKYVYITIRNTVIMGNE